MKARLAVSLLWASAALSGMAQAGEGLDVKMSPLHFGALQEFGIIKKGLLTSDPVAEITDEWVDHFGTYLVQEATVNDRLTLKGGLGGIFQFPKPELSQEEFGGSQYKMFYIGPSIAEAMYHFGGVENSAFSVGGGMFPYQYNPDANNLGAYLFRSGPYPTYIMTGGNGGLTVIGNQSTPIEGFRANAHTGNLDLDIILATETGLPPLYDFSLALVAGYKIADGLVEVGGGVNFKRLIQIDKKKTTVHALQNSYFQKGGTWYSGEAVNYSRPASFMVELADSARAKNTHADSLLADAYTTKSLALTAIADSLAVGGPWVDATTGLVAGAQYYTPAGTMLMGRASVDFKKLFSSEIFSAQDLRLYGEFAVLGVKNYPVYYEKITDRIPFMVGFNVPTYKILDLMSVQFEYYNSPNLNSTFSVGQKNWSIPYIPENSLFSQNEFNDLTKKDNYAWSILLRKQILSSLTLNAQFARDHLRTIGTNWFYGSRFEPNEILHKTSSWYGMFQLGWNI
jgi:hypothetical protein